MPRAKKSVREWFVAELKAGVLTPRRGCTRVVAEIGETIEEKSTREPQRTLTANIGDRLILCGVGVDQIQSAEVRAIKADGYRAQIFVSLGYGAVNDGVVHVLKAGKAA